MQGLLHENKREPNRRRRPTVVLVMLLFMMTWTNPGGSLPIESEHGAEVGQGELPVLALSPGERGLVGTWHRHDFEEGGVDFLIFLENRTGCAWRETARGAFEKRHRYVHWELDESRESPGSILLAEWATEGEIALIDPRWTPDGAFWLVGSEIWKGRTNLQRWHKTSSTGACHDSEV